MNITKNETIATLGDLLNYTQPSKYIVRSTDYRDEYEIPVLTAGKSFIKGYTNDTENVFCDLPTIIFDDFTTASRLVNFQFKVKSSAMKILTPASDLVDIEYIFYFMQTIRVNTDTHKRYWIAVFSRIPIKIIPLPEQRAIVAKIERLFSELDSGIAHLKAAKAKLETYRQSVLKTAFDGKLLSSEQLKACKKEADYEPAGDLLKKISPKAMPSESKIRADWVEVQYKQVVDKISASKNKIKQRDYLPQGKYPVIDQGQSLIGGYTDNRKKLVECGLPVIVFGDHTKVVKLVSFQFVSGADGTKILQPKKFILPKYLAYTTRVIVSIIENKGYARHYQHIEKQHFSFPPLPEQRAIVSAIESRFAVCDKLSQDIDEALEKSQAMRQSILKKAFDGELLNEAELRECRKQPDWEPAAKLLQRIKESKPSKPARRKK